MSARLRVLLGQEIHKLTLPSVIPGTVAELKAIVQETFMLEGDFSPQYIDTDFGDQFFTLTGTDEIKDKDTIKVVYIEPPPVVTLTLQECFDTNSTQLSEDACSSGSSHDTVMLSSPESTSSQRSHPWPAQFEIPCFAFDTELILQAANEAYRKDGTLLDNPGVKSDILEKLAESLYGWQSSLKHKMGNYRAKLRRLRWPELDVNSVKRKSADERAPAKNIKKPKKAELTQIEEEFRRITMIRLESTFMEKLDCYMPRLLSLFKKKGGAAGVKLQGIQEMLYGVCAHDITLQSIIFCAIFAACKDANIQEDLTQHVLKIFVVNKGATDDDNPVAVGIAIEGAEVLSGISSVAQACTFLMGLIYALNLSYPKELKYTFEVFQKVFLELNVDKTKVQSLRRKLLA
ncbi:hypothetical protein HHUSO_G19990 [Huso huso]|uniref:Uncharacterized protein n=1 Tax=Huso huso TaxID=61971 RepID=A0ABR0Z374_HUSHU